MSAKVVDMNTVETERPVFDGKATLRVLKVEKQTSKKGNPMLVFTHEFAAPEVITLPNGNTYKLAGRQTTDWIVLAEMGFKKLKPFHKCLALPSTVNIDTPDTKQYVGKAVDCLIKTEPSVLKDEQTGEPVVDEE